MANSVWEMEAKGGGDYELPPAGSHAAVLVALFDLGHHVEKYGDDPPYSSRKLFLVWEITSEKSETGAPFFIGARFTRSMSDKSNLGRLIASWRGQSLGKGEKFDLSKLLGQSCLLTVTHEISARGNTYASVTSAGKLPKSLKAGKPTVKIVQWSFDSNKEPPTESWIPWVCGQELLTVLRESSEWKDRHGDNGAARATTANDKDPF
jgi:hypothetical protein